MNQVRIRQGEIPSINANCSARGLAKIVACMVNGGQLEGVRVMSEEAVEKLQAEPGEAEDANLPGFKTAFSQGGVNHFR